MANTLLGSNRSQTSVTFASWALHQPHCLRGCVRSPLVCTPLFQEQLVSRKSADRHTVSRHSTPNLLTDTMLADLLFKIWKRCACQRIWCCEAGNAVPVNGFGVQKLETLPLSADLYSKSENVVPVSGFGVESLETLRFLANMMWGGWKGCACQGIWCSMCRNVVPVSGFSVQNPETLCLSADLYSKSENVVPVSGFGVQSLETLRFLKNMVWGGWKRCACQGIWRSMSRNVVPCQRI